MSLFLIIVVILAIAGITYFWDDFGKWYEKFPEYLKKFKAGFNNIGSKSKYENQAAEIRKNYNEVLSSKRPMITAKQMRVKSDGGGYQKKIAEQVRETRNRKIKGKSSDGMAITEWERDFLWDGISKRKRVPCINCEKEDMYQGPQGGMSTNWRCPNCGQGINLTFISNGRNGFWCDNIGIDSSWIRK